MFGPIAPSIFRHDYINLQDKNSSPCFFSFWIHTQRYSEQFWYCTGSELFQCSVILVFNRESVFFFTLTINSFHSLLFERLIIFASVYCPYLYILILFSFFIRCHTIHPIQDILSFVHAYLPFTDPSSSILKKCSLHFVVLIDFFSLLFVSISFIIVYT